MAFDTVANVVSEAAIELGLGSVSDVYGSTDSNVLQLRTLVKRVGRELAREWPWSHLRKEHTFSTVGGTSTYALPADFGAMLDQTGWNRTGSTPLVGPTSAQEWAYLKGRTTLSTLNLVFRPWQGQIQFAAGTSTPDAQSVAFEYTSSYWVVPQGETVPTLDAPTANSDTLWLDSELLIAAIRTRFLRAKGLDSSAAQQDFETALAKAQGQDSPAPILRLGGGHRHELLDGCNVPETGFGGGVPF